MILKECGRGSRTAALYLAPIPEWHHLFRYGKVLLLLQRRRKCRLRGSNVLSGLRIPAGLYALSFVLFAFPFIMVSCAGTPVAQYSGYGFAFGPEDLSGVGERGDPEWTLLVVLGAMAVALLACLLGNVGGSRIAGRAALVFLVIFVVKVFGQAANARREQDIPLGVTFEYGLWLTGAALLAAVILAREEPEQAEKSYGTVVTSGSPPKQVGEESG